MSLLDDVSIVVTPNGYKAGELYAVIPVPSEGAEDVVNGDFATDSSWSEGGGATISGGQANIDGDGTSFASITQSNVFTEGKRYKVTADVIITSGLGLKFQDGANNENIGFATTTGSYEFYFIATSNTSFVIGRRTGGTAFDSSVDNVSVKEYTSADMDVTRATAATRVDENGLVNYAEIIGSELVTNGDFELNSDWNNFGTPTTSEQSTEQSHTGTYSWKVIADATLEGIYSPNNFSLTSGLQYTVSLWVYSVSGTSIKSGLNNTNVSVFTVRTVTAGQWTNITYEATATSTGASYISILSENSLNFYVDDVTVKEVTRDNVPRIDYTGGGCPHILSEPQRTNLINYSEDFSQSYWTKSGVTQVTSNQATSPDGTENADLIVSDGTTGVFKGGIFVTGVVTRSVYLKSVTGTVNVILKDPNLTVTQKTLTVTEEWQRFELIESNGTSAQGIWLDDIPASGIYIWGAQLEAGSYATSYIPTSGSTVTRNQDIFTRDGIGSLINSTEGVLFVEMAALADDSVIEGISLSDGTTDNRVVIFKWNASNTIRGRVTSGGTNTLNQSETLSDITSFNKIAIKYKLNDFAIWINGVEVFTDNSGAVPIGLNQLYFSSTGGGLGSDFLGKVKQLQVYNTALTDEQLTSLTT